MQQVRIAASGIPVLHNALTRVREVNGVKCYEALCGLMVAITNIDESVFIDDHPAHYCLCSLCEKVRKEIEGC